MNEGDGHERQVSIAARILSPRSSLSSETVPLLPPAVGMCCGILLVAMPAVLAAGWLAGSAVGFFAVLACCCLDKPSRRGFAIGLLAGLPLAALHLSAPWQSYRKQIVRPANGWVEAVVTDPFADQGLWESESRWRSVQGSIRSLRLEGADAPVRCRGKIQLLVPADTEVEYGDLLVGYGSFTQPLPPAVPGQFDYRRHLLSQGIAHQFKCAAPDILGSGSGWRRCLASSFRFRDRIARILVDGFRSDRHARAAAAMTLGYRNALDSATRTVFLRSGALHIFAISGLHVGIAATVVLMLLQLGRVRYRLRFLMLPFLLGGYVFLTGGAPSAVRAWIMLSVLSLAASTLVPRSPLNSIALAAIVLLACNPLLIFNTGFQFSFIIVAVLVLGWRLAGDINATIAEKASWAPGQKSRPRRLLRACGLKARQLVACGTLAWLGGTGLVAWSNCLFIPASLWVNIAVAVLAAFSLSCALLKSAVALIGLAWAGRMLALPLEFFLAMIRSLVEIAANGRGCIGIPQPWLPLVFFHYLALLAMLLPKSSRRIRIWAALALLANLFFLCAGGEPKRPGVTLVNGDGDGNVACSVEMPGTPPLVMFSGNYAVDRMLADLLKSQGNLHLQRVLYTRRTPGTSRDLARLQDTFRIEHIHLPGEGPVREGHAEPGTPVPRISSADLAATKKTAATLDLVAQDGRRTSFAFRQAAGQQIQIDIRDARDASAEVEIVWPDGRRSGITLPAARYARAFMLRPPTPEARWQTP